MLKNTLKSLSEKIREVGDQSGEGKPVPVPNTEVNLPSDLLSTSRKRGNSRTLLTIFIFYSIVFAVCFAYLISGMLASAGKDKRSCL